jgi:hypothetical protein
MEQDIAHWWQQAGDRAGQPAAWAGGDPATPPSGRPAPSSQVTARTQFFAQVLDRIGEQRPGFRQPRPGSENYIAFGGGPFGHYAVSFINDGRLRVGVLLEMQTADQTKCLFDLLVGDRVRIDQQLDEQLDWDRNDARIRSWFGLHRPAPDLRDQQESAQAATWAADVIVKLMGKLDERLRSEALRLRQLAATPGAGLQTPETTTPVGSQPSDLGSAFQVAALVAADHRQRAVPLEFNSVDVANGYRDRLRSALASRAAAQGSALAHVRPWVWTSTSGGGALTDHGGHTGVEVRLSFYERPMAGDPQQHDQDLEA